MALSFGVTLKTLAVLKREEYARERGNQGRFLAVLLGIVWKLRR
jgi:hypothetical protein